MKVLKLIMMLLNIRSTEAIDCSNSYTPTNFDFKYLYHSASGTKVSPFALHYVDNGVVGCAQPVCSISNDGNFDGQLDSNIQLSLSPTMDLTISKTDFTDGYTSLICMRCDSSGYQIENTFILSQAKSGKPISTLTYVTDSSGTRYLKTLSTNIHGYDTYIS